MSVPIETYRLSTWLPPRRVTLGIGRDRDARHQRAVGQLPTVGQVGAQSTAAHGQVDVVERRTA